MTEVRLEEYPDKDTKRDAVHFPCIPVQANENMSACTRVCFMKYPMVRAAEDHEKCDGFLSPFITQEVYLGDWVWMVMAPGSTQNLRHNWSHPSVPDDDTATVIEVPHDDDGCRGCYD